MSLRIPNSHISLLSSEFRRMFCDWRSSMPKCCFSGKGCLGGSRWASTRIQETRLLDRHQAKSPDEDAAVCSELGPTSIKLLVISDILSQKQCNFSILDSESDGFLCVFIKCLSDYNIVLNQSAKYARCFLIFSNTIIIFWRIYLTGFLQVFAK